jgi:hypothetical protein
MLTGRGPPRGFPITVRMATGLARHPPYSVTGRRVSRASAVGCRGKRRGSPRSICAATVFLFFFSNRNLSSPRANVQISLAVGARAALSHGRVGHHVLDLPQLRHRHRLTGTTPATGVRGVVSRLSSEGCSRIALQHTRSGRSTLAGPHTAKKRNRHAKDSWKDRTRVHDRRTPRRRVHHRAAHRHPVCRLSARLAMQRSSPKASPTSGT